mgnify:CR=1 FL=1
MKNGTPVTPATTATSLTMKVAPLGFEIAYTGTNTVANGFSSRQR